MPYQINVDERAHLMVFTRSGFLSPIEAAQYTKDTLAGMAVFGGEPFSVIVDISQSEIMSQDVSHTVELNLAQMKAAGAVRVAYVGGSALERLQIRRIGRSYEWLKFFQDIEGARSWAIG